MIALYIPMQPSSKTPMRAFFSRSCAAIPAPICSSFPGSFTAATGTTWLVSWRTLPVASHDSRWRWKAALAKSSAQSVA